MSKLKLHISPASAGVVTIPIGHGRVFGKKLPDLFVVNSPDSTHPGLFLYEFMNFVDGRPSFPTLLCSLLLKYSGRKHPFLAH